MENVEIHNEIIASAPNLRQNEKVLRDRILNKQWKWKSTNDNPMKTRLYNS